MSWVKMRKKKKSFGYEYIASAPVKLQLKSLDLLVSFETSLPCFSLVIDHWEKMMSNVVQQQVAQSKDSGGHNGVKQGAVPFYQCLNQ